MNEAHIAKVVVNLSLDRSFDYNIPPPLRGHVRVGMQVMVPFGRSRRPAYVLEIVSESSYSEALKDIEMLNDTRPHLPPKLVELGRWMAEYYCCAGEKAIRTLLPEVIRSGRVKHKQKSYCYIADTALAERFMIEHARKAKAKCALLKVLFQQQTLPADRLMKEAGAGSGALKALIKEGLVTEEKRVVEADPFEDSAFMATVPHELTDEQGEALKIILDKLSQPDPTPHALLLHGVTGSGKTEVYLQAIAQAQDLGKEAIVLVPEISLTPQTVARFRARFGERVSVLHSMLSDRARFNEWNRINDGKVKICVGARSALFAPFRNLGLIVVDEEHENSYKQGESPRYHARDVAVMRGRLEKAVVLLGSATPSFESYSNALSGKYCLLKLTKRVDDLMMPEMRVVDMRREALNSEHPGFFSKTLLEAVRRRIAQGEQAILFLNRLGYARQMLCEHCGYVARCPDCSVPYTYHKKRESLSCHLCGAVIPAHVKCPDCSAEDIRYMGVGTEKVETIAGALFKGAKIARMDSDTMRNPASYERVLNDFKRGAIDILIGTQMIAKGLHFPNVTLVGIINADQGLYLPDFRAEERTFQLLTQVSGRAGRGDKGGEVIVQTFNPFNPAIDCAVNYDFGGFYERDMEVRRELLYPPCGHMIVVHFKGADSALVSAFANEFAEKIQPALNDGIRVSAPAPAPIERIKAQYRYMMMFRGQNLKKLRQLIREMLLHGERPKGVDAYADVDALSLL